MRHLPHLALGALVALSGCRNGCNGESGEDAGVDAGPRELAEKEPNDRPEQALALDGSSIVTATLGADPTKADEDWYALTTTKVSTADVSVTGIPGTDLTLEVYDTDRNRLMQVNSEGEGKPERIPNLAVRGKVLVRVAAAKKGTGGAYSLTALFSEAPAGFELEPNDRAVDSNALPLGQSVSGYIGHAADEDWYRFELVPGGGDFAPAPSAPDAAAAVAPAPTPAPVTPSPAPPVTPSGVEGRPSGAEGMEPGTAAEAGPVVDAGSPAAPIIPEVPKLALKIDLTPVDGLRFDLSVLSEAEAPLFQVKTKDGEGLSLRNIGVRATDRVIYVVVKSAWSGTGKDAKRAYNAQKYYTLAVAQEEGSATAELEPNDELLKATPLPRDGYREGFLSPKNDVDYYVLKTGEPALAKIQLTGVERLDLVLSMVKPSDQPGGKDVVLLTANDGTVKEPESLNNVFCPGECFFQVQGAMRKGPDGKLVRDYENSELAYRLSATVVPDNGSEEREPNNTFELATPLALGTAVRGTIHPKKDTDLYKLDLSGRVVRTPIKATLTGILKVDVGLYLHQVDEETGKLSLVQTSDRAKGEAPETIRFSAEPGVYVLEVRDAKNRESNFQDSYQLTVEEGE